MELLESHKVQHIVTGILLSIVVHIALLHVSKLSEKNITAEIFSPPSIINFQFVKEKKAPSMPTIKEEGQESKIQKMIIEEEAQDKELSYEEMLREKIIEEIPRQEHAIPIVSEVKLNGKRISPQYPKRSLRLRQQGIVIINVLIGTDGKQQKITIAKSSSHPLLDQSAIDAVSKWDFLPTIENGVPILSWVQVPVEFTIK